MFAMRDDEMFAMFIVFASGVVITGLALFYKHRRARLDVISKALSHPDLDADSRKSLVDELRGAGPASEWHQSLGAQIRFLSRNALFVVGWVTMFIGVGCVLTGKWNLIEGGIVAAVSGLGVATLPLALRELQSRTS